MRPPIHRQQTAYILTLSLAFEMEQCGKALGAVTKAVQRHCVRGMHGKRMVAMIIVTNETVDELGSRLEPTLSALDEIENYWLMRAPMPWDIVAKHGSFDPALFRVREAWVKAWEINKPNDMREAQRRNAVVEQRGENRQGRAIVKMPVKP